VSDAGVAAWVDGLPVPVEEVDARLQRLRDRDRAAALPQPASREGRQLRRWATQVAVVERLCVGELAARDREAQGLPRAAGATAVTTDGTTDVTTDGTTAGAPSRAEAAALGSIVAAAWANEPAVARAAAAVTAEVTLSPAERERAARLAASADGRPVWSDDELLASARIEAFSRWLATATHDRVRLTTGYEHPGDSAQPDNVHQH
jgi:[acyl-carrier-protein] S-malonyltransferase